MIKAIGNPSWVYVTVYGKGEDVIRFLISWHWITEKGRLSWWAWVNQVNPLKETSRNRDPIFSLLAFKKQVAMNSICTNSAHSLKEFEGRCFPSQVSRWRCSPAKPSFQPVRSWVENPAKLCLDYWPTKTEVTDVCSLSQHVVVICYKAI